MYKLSILNKFGQYFEIKDDNLERLKLIAKRMNANGSDVEITKQEVLFRIINMNN
jgi:hypothetical protein